MKDVQSWINKFNKVFGLDIWVDSIENNEATLKIETPTGVYIGTITLRKDKEIWKFSSIGSAFGGDSWNKLISI